MITLLSNIIYSFYSWLYELDHMYLYSGLTVSAGIVITVITLTILDVFRRLAK